MKLAFAAALAIGIASPAVAQERYEQSGGDLTEVCGYYFNPANEGQSHLAMGCAYAVDDWLIDTTRWNLQEVRNHYQNTADAFRPKDTECGVHIIMRHLDMTVAEALEAEFDSSCGEPGIM